MTIADNNNVKSVLTSTVKALYGSQTDFEVKKVYSTTVIGPLAVPPALASYLVQPNVITEFAIRSYVFDFNQEQRMCTRFPLGPSASTLQPTPPHPPHTRAKCSPSPFAPAALLSAARIWWVPAILKPLVLTLYVSRSPPKPAETVTFTDIVRALDAYQANGMFGLFVWLGQDIVQLTNLSENDVNAMLTAATYVRIIPPAPFLLLYASVATFQRPHPG